jgi:hypothetical protein
VRKVAGSQVLLESRQGFDQRQGVHDPEEGLNLVAELSPDEALAIELGSEVAGIDMD